MTALPEIRFSAEDYLAWEAEQEQKYEYLLGDVYAMAGASDAHVTVSGNLFAILRSHLRGKPCRAYISDMKLQLDQANAYFYPDVFVTCAAADVGLSNFKREPLLVVEVLSPSTAAYDRGLKFAHYRQLPSLQEYVLIDTERLAVDLFRRDAEGHWVLYPFAADETLTLTSVDLDLPLAAIYEDVTLETH
ncbi:MAG: Uma2 family endonuclease [Gammaproteobacteria bacterium SHHR-1]